MMPMRLIEPGSTRPATLDLRVVCAALRHSRRLPA
jgi:hypothetical protein